MAATYQLKRGFTITRLLDAPRDAVYRAWTDPAHLGWFFNPKTVPDAPIQVDPRVGGEWLATGMREGWTETLERLVAQARAG